MGEQFEYSIQQIPLTSVSGVIESERWMNQLGALGWEMVGLAGIDKTIGLNKALAVFRRRMKPLVEPEAEPSWQADPVGRHEFRWWDGYRWTQKVSDQGTTTDDPPIP